MAPIQDLNIENYDSANLAPSEISDFVVYLTVVSQPV